MYFATIKKNLLTIFVWVYFWNLYSVPLICVSVLFNCIYLFLAVLGLRRCMQAFSSCGERGLLFVVLRGLLIAVASLVAEHRL